MARNSDARGFLKARIEEHTYIRTREICEPRM
jgi:hypothetical protein